MRRSSADPPDRDSGHPERGSGDQGRKPRDGAERRAGDRFGARGDQGGRSDRGETPPPEEFGIVTIARLVLETLAFAAVARLSALYGRDRSLWVFGARGGEAFVDNAKYLYLHAVERRPEVRPVWLSRNHAVVERLQAEGYEAYYTYSLRGVYYNLRAGVVCLTQGFGDVNLACAGGAEAAQLWHGIPLKRIGWDAEFPAHPLPVRLCLGYLARNVSLLVLTARGLSGPFASGLRVDRDRMGVGGYPRNDALVREVPGEGIGIDDDVGDRLDRVAGEGPLLFYLPTFRAAGGREFEEHLDFDALERFLAERDAHLAVKPHPKESVDLGERTGSRVIEVPPGNDVYPLVRRADVLVTDYSSVLFDWLLLDRPVVFYSYDLDRYREERGFYLDYEAVTPGPTATDFGELLAALGSVLDGDEFAPERAAVRDRFFEYPDADQSALTCRLVVDRLSSGSRSRVD